MKVSDAFKGFIEAEDLPEGQDIKVTITKVRKATRADKGQSGQVLENPIASIKGKDKEWVLNKTNAKAIRRMYGNEMDGWAGKEVVIYRTTCNAFGNAKTPCIRVREEMQHGI